MMNHERTLYAAVKGERSDCAVRTFALAANVPYEESHVLFAKHGRKNGKVTKHSVTVAVLAERFPAAKLVRCRISLNQFTQNNPQGRFVVHVRGHLVMIDAGTLHDWSPKPRRIVRWYAQVA